MTTPSPPAARAAYLPAVALHKSLIAAMWTAGIPIIGVHGTADGIRVKALALRLAFINGKSPSPQPIPASLFNPDAEVFLGL
jgi:hypothetical protein